MATKRKSGFSAAKRVAIGVGGAVAAHVIRKLAARARPEAAVARLLEESRAGRRDTVSGAEMRRTLRLLRKRAAQRVRERAKA